MYEWKVILINDREYIIKNDISDMNDFVEKISSSEYSRTRSSWDLSEKDNNGCKSVILFSENIISVEYNLK